MEWTENLRRFAAVRPDAVLDGERCQWGGVTLGRRPKSNRPSSYGSPEVTILLCTTGHGGPVITEDTPFYTLAQSLLDGADGYLELKCRRKLLGKGYRWQTKTDLPEGLILQLQERWLQCVPERPDFFTLLLEPAGDGQRLLTVRTGVLPNSWSSLPVQLNYHPEGSQDPGLCLLESMTALHAAARELLVSSQL